MHKKFRALAALCVATLAGCATGPFPPPGPRTLSYVIDSTSYPLIRPITRGDCTPSPNAPCIIEVRVKNDCANADADLVPMPDYMHLKRPGRRNFEWQVLDSPGWTFDSSGGIVTYQDPDGQVLSNGRHPQDPTKWVLEHKAEKNKYQLSYQIKLVNAGRECILDPGLVTDW
jgi:hypothetical protein